MENLYSYDGFGNLIEKKEDIANRILYTGQQYDQETGQYYLRARYYNPVIGRFTQKDTYRGDGLNLYAYCDNNPVMYYVPSGYGGTPTTPTTCRNTGDGKKPKDPEVKRVNEGGSTSGYNGYEANLNVEQQNKHIPGTNEYKVAINIGQNKSIMFGNEDDIQELLNEFSGKGTPINANKERVDFGRLIGQYYDSNSNQLLDTTMGVIHYGKDGAHIVPARPN